MRGHDPRIHDLNLGAATKSRMAGSNPAMTMDFGRAASSLSAPTPRSVPVRYLFTMANSVLSQGAMHI